MTKSAFFRTSFAGALFVGSVLFGWQAVRQREIQTWVPTEGEVVRMWTETSTMPPHKGKYVTVPPREVSERWVKYSYEVGGRTYVGEARIASGHGPGFRVYYDPDHPEESSLSRPPGAAPFLLAFGAAVQFLAAIILGTKS